MGTFALYTKVSNATIRKQAAKSIPNIKKWFVQNPKRRICNTEMWYGKIVKIRKDHIEEDINRARDAALE